VSGRTGALALAVAIACGVVASAPPRAHAAVAVTIAAASPVYLVDEGDTAHVGVRLTTAGAVPTDAPVTVSYMTGATLTVDTGANVKTLPSTASPGLDYQPATGTLTFPVATASGTVLTFDVDTRTDASPEVAETINVSLSSPGNTVVDDPPTVVINAHGFPYLDSSLPIAQRVADLVSRMSLAEKVGQMTQPERPAFAGTTTTSASSPNDIRAWLIGSILSGGGSVPASNTPQGWADMVDGFESRALATPLQIPLVYGLDVVHGDNNLRSATIFPHNIGIGASRDPEIAELEGQVAAAETRATGPHWAFSPCICVARDDRWGRTYESYSEDPALVQLMETVIDGFQGPTPTSKGDNDRLLATAKHYAGDGGTLYGSSASGFGRIDQGMYVGTRADFDRLFVSPYIPAVQVHHVGSIMPSYSSVQFTDVPGMTPLKMHAEKELLTDVLKGQIGFDGFLISDYNAIDQITTVPPNDYNQQVAISINSGLDMIMVPSNYRTFETDLIAQVTSAAVPVSRIDDAVRRILTQKFELGLFEHPFTDRSNFGTVGSAANRAVARRAAAESQVLLKNAGNILPLSKTAKILVTGSNANNIGNQTGGWTVSWQGASGNPPSTGVVTGGTTIFDAMHAVDANAAYQATPTTLTGFDVGVVVVGEFPYAEFCGDVGANCPPGVLGNGFHPNLDLSASDQAAIDAVCAAMPCAVLIVSGRPLTVYDTAAWDGIVASWLPGSEGAGVADVLFGEEPFTGRLPMSWPRALEQEPINVGDTVYDPLYPYGWGLRTIATKPALQQARDSLAAIAGDTHVAAAVSYLDQLLATAAAWNPDGSVANPTTVFARLAQATAQLAQTSAETYVQDDGVVSAARDVAQATIVQAGGPTVTTSSCIANADHQLAAGRPDIAVDLLRNCAGVPTAARVSSFTARRAGRSLVLRWRTASENGLLGFDVYRRGTRLNAALIPARHRAGGASYVYRDRFRGASKGYYTLEAVRFDGSRFRLASARLTQR
jgi:beta-glucosidase